jgi:DNA-directed RNA polymerase sigma subunit (sigma70/sigma32)
LTTGNVETLAEIAADMGVSKDRIRQLEERALRLLRHPDSSKPLREYNDFLIELKSR